MDAYASVGMPVNYRHWRYGKQFIATEKQLPARPDGPGLRDRHQLRPLHRLPDGGEHDDDAGAGHRPCRLRPQLASSRATTCSACGPTPTSIIDYLVYARNYIAECEERHGVEAVEDLLDCLPRADEPRRRPLPAAEPSCRWRKEQARQQRARGLRCSAGQRPVAHPAARRRAGRRSDEAKRFPSEPQENLLYFIEKNAPLLEPWQREIVRIVRKIAQYFYPQRQTQVMNEGWATFWHYTPAQHAVRRRPPHRRLHDRVPEVAHQRRSTSRPSASRAYSGINPYALGFAMYTDIRRICETADRRGPRTGSPTSPAATG